MKLSTEEIQSLQKDLPSSWSVNDQGHLFKEFSFQNFLEPLAFANKVAPIAESMQHHPDITIRWGSFGVEIWTHDVGGLTKKDFDLAKKIESLA